MTDQNIKKEFLERAIELSRIGMQHQHGGPFGCVIVKNDTIVAEGYNEVLATNDPTAHAEIVAIRKACDALKTFQLEGCDIYTSCEPCPMCLGAIYWARPDRVIYANTRDEAASIAFDDAFIYAEIGKELQSRKIPFIHYPHILAREVFDDWEKMESKKQY